MTNRPGNLPPEFDGLKSPSVPDPSGVETRLTPAQQRRRELGYPEDYVYERLIADLETGTCVISAPGDYEGWTAKDLLVSGLLEAVIARGWRRTDLVG